MEHARVEDLYTGQILAQTVYDAKGNEVCAAGQIISEADREKLRKARIATVPVHIGLYREADLKVRKDAVEARFLKVKDPVLLMFKRVALERMALLKV